MSQKVSKMVAVVERLRGESSIADVCRKYQISEVFTIADGTSLWKLEVGPWLLGMDCPICEASFS
jgi:hypothetical protein